MEYHILESSLRNIYANYEYEGPGSIFYASNLEHVDLHTFKSMLLVGIAMMVSQSSDYSQITKLGDEAITDIMKTSDRNKARQIFQNFKDATFEK